MLGRALFVCPFLPRGVCKAIVCFFLLVRLFASCVGKGRRGAEEGGRGLGVVDIM